MPTTLNTCLANSPGITFNQTVFGKTAIFEADIKIVKGSTTATEIKIKHSQYNCYSNQNTAFSVYKFLFYICSTCSWYLEKSLETLQL